MIRINKLYYGLFALAILYVFSGCTKSGLSELKKENLFSLNIGKIDNAIDLFQIPGKGFAAKNRIYMRNGIFYIANGNSNKLMEFSSYGDLIFMLYNPLMNSKPVLLDSDLSGKEKTTRRAVKYNFHQIGEIVVDSSNSLWVEDVVSRDKYVRDKKRNIVLKKVVRHFTREGKLINYIGQEGIGGTPFPYIENLYITVNNEPVVVTRTPLEWDIFWFYSSGELRYHIKIDNRHLPDPSGDDTWKGEIGKIIADYNDSILYVAVSYFKDIIDPSTHTRSGVKKTGSYIYTLDLKDKLYKELIKIPDTEQLKEVVGTKELKIPGPSYELMGITKNKFIFFLRNEGVNKYKLLIKDFSGKTAAIRIMTIEDTALYFKYITVAPSGIIYGILADDNEAHIVWWRSDKLLKKDEENK